MTESFTDMLRDPELTWVAIQEATQEHREVELSEIAISLYGQLGEARAEISRLRTCLRASFRALAPHGAPSDLTGP
jgi:hypothetical protein